MMFLYNMTALFIPTILLLITTHGRSEVSLKQQSNYQSVASLDRYGQSQQIQNAMRASSQHGIPIIAALAEEDKSIIVCYIQQPKKPGVKNDKKHLERMVQIISCTDDRNNYYKNDDDDNNEEQQHSKTMTAMICSGVKADGKLLIQMLREYARKTWERYDTIPMIFDISNEARDILLSFMGYSTNDNNDLFLKLFEEDGDGDDLRMSRPFGVQSLLFGIAAKKKKDSNLNSSTINDYPIIQSIDPSGMTQSWVARALGHSNEEMNRKLQLLWKRNMSIEDVKQMCSDIFMDFYEKNEHLLLDTDKNHDDLEIVFEILDGTVCTWNVDKRTFVF